MIRKKILIHSIVFSPDSVSTAYIYNDIALGLIANGFDVVVLTSTPHYNIVESEILKQKPERKYFGIYYKSVFKGIDVYHIPLKKHKSTLIRIFSFIYWHIFSFIFALTLRNINFILSPSPPLSIGLISILIGKIKGAKTIYNVQEIYPDLLINHQNLKSPFIINFLKWIEKFVYNYSNAVTTIDYMFYSTILPRFKDPKKLHIIPNFVDTDLYRPLKNNYILPSVFSKENKKIKFMYAGNIGFFQDWEPILFAAKELTNENIEFWIIGEGVQKLYLEKEVKNRNLKNIQIFPYQNREHMPSIINYGDVHFISINPKMDENGFPSKIYTIMACAKPLIVITGEKSPLFNFFKNKQCAELITIDRNVNFTNSIKNFASNEQFRKDFGNNGFNEIINNFTKEAIVNKYVLLLNSL
jgi:glycosyltransferase involved in cell wall biosynthesis